jgi:streptomycin 6-kinase
MSFEGVPDAVRNKALLAGAESWLEGLPTLVADLEADWSLSVGRPYAGGTEAFVAEVTLGNRSPAVLKLLIPRDDDAARNEITVLQLAAGDGCAPPARRRRTQRRSGSRCWTQRNS